MSQPVSIHEAFLIALQHHQAGRLHEAEPIYRQILEQTPYHADALHLLGVVAHQSGKHEIAIDLILRAIAMNPKEAEYYGNLGEAYRAAGQDNDALRVYQKALSMKPDMADTHANLAIVLCQQKEYDQALAACRKALAIKPDMARAWNNMGNVYDEIQDIDQALALYDKAIALQPNFSDAYRNRIRVLFRNLRLLETLETYARLMASAPANPDDHWNYALLSLLHGRFERGWEEYEWRWKSSDFPSPIRNFSQPLWTGQNLAGKTILLHAEQGFGDAIQFVRYVPLVAARAGKVIVEAHEEVARLLQSIQGAALVIARGTPLPPFDYHSPFVSLPRTFNTNLTNIPAQVPYLKADPAAVTGWKDRLAATIPPGALKVGLSWAGRPTHRENKNRSRPLAEFAPLFQIPGVRLVSLQKGPAVADIAASGLSLLDTADQLRDFADTAALVENLDLVISVDTAVAHLAGALAKPAWTMISRVPDWRWFLDRTDTPWYPTMRLYRQQQLNEWGPVIARIAADLAALAETNAPPPQTDNPLR